MPEGKLIYDIVWLDTLPYNDDLKKYGVSEEEWQQTVTTLDSFVKANQSNTTSKYTDIWMMPLVCLGCNVLCCCICLPCLGYAVYDSKYSTLY